MHSVCPHCGYDLTGLSKVGSCPECGSGFGPSTTVQHGTYLMRYGKVWVFASIALAILVIGGLISIFMKDKVGGVLLTLVLAALPAFAAFVYWWAQRQDEREHK